MLCINCGDGYICEPLPKPLVLTYRGFKKQIGTQIYLSCSNCLYVSTEPSDGALDMQEEMIAFKREVNMKLSVGEDL